MTGRWGRTRAVDTALGAGLVVLLLGALAGRADVAVLGVAPVLAAAWDLARRPADRARVSLRPDHGAPDHGAPDHAAPDHEGTGVLRSRVWIEVPDGVGTARLRVSRPGARVAHALVRVDGGREIGVVVRTVRTGPQVLATAEVHGLGAGLASVGQPERSDPWQVTVLPPARTLGDLPLPYRLRGLAGPHESRRPGDGGGLRDVHPFAPGDRLRRIDWRVTARRSPDLSELYVRRTYALADAVVMLVVDSRDDVGPDPATWSGTEPVRPQDVTSLDLARQGAASLARRLVTLGDRVGLDDLGVHRRPVAPGGGRRQLDRILHSLARTHPDGDPIVRRRPPQIPSGALVVVFSTFLDDDAARAARTWRRAGHRVVAVDVLPPVREHGLIARERLALRMVRIERADRLAELRANGVELVGWATGDPAVELAQHARRAHGRTGAGAGR